MNENIISEDRIDKGMKRALIQYIKDNREKEGLLWRFICFVSRSILSRVSRNSRCSSSIILKSIIKSGHSSNTISIGKKSLIYNCHIIISGKNSHIEIGQECVLRCAHIIVLGDNANCYIGNKVTINANAANMTGINIGDNTVLVVGDETLLSKGIGIYTTDFHRIYDDNNKLINENRNVTIGKHVWIGMHTIVLKGATISDNCVVGAGSLVSTSIEEPSSVAIGRPAKVIKRDLHWEK